MFHHIESRNHKLFCQNYFSYVSMVYLVCFYDFDFNPGFVHFFPLTFFEYYSFLLFQSFQVYRQVIIMRFYRHVLLQKYFYHFTSQAVEQSAGCSTQIFINPVSKTSHYDPTGGLQDSTAPQAVAVQTHLHISLHQAHAMITTVCYAQGHWGSHGLTLTMTYCLHCTQLGLKHYDSSVL